MLGFVFDLVVRMIAGAIEKTATPPRPTTPRPEPARQIAVAEAYRRWAATHRLVLDAGDRCYRGALGRHAVRVAAGLDGSAPIGVEAEVSVPHGQSTTALLEASTSATTPTEEALVALFQEPRLANELRSIALLRGGVRLRFRALTAPAVVERALSGAVEVLEVLGRAPRDAPYR